jgi:hypothetical protein
MFQKLNEDSKENIFRVLWDSTVKISQGFEDSSRMSRGLHKQQGYFEVSIWWFIEKFSRVRGFNEDITNFEVLNYRSFFEDPRIHPRFSEDWRKQWRLLKF